MDRPGRNEQDVASRERHRRRALDLIHQRAFEDIDDLFARMRVPGGRQSRRDVDAHLDDLASGDAEIVPLEIGARESRLLLRRRQVQRQGTADDQHRCRHDTSHLHVDLLSSLTEASVHPCVIWPSRRSVHHGRDHAQWRSSIAATLSGAIGMPRGAPQRRAAVVRNKFIFPRIMALRCGV